MTDDKQGISSKAPFLAAGLFFGILFWTSQSPILPETSMVRNLKIAQMAIYGFLGIASAAYGAYLHTTGKKTVDRPRKSHLIWSVVFLVVVTVMGIAVMLYESPNGSPNLPRSEDPSLGSGPAR